MHPSEKDTFTSSMYIASFYGKGVSLGLQGVHPCKATKNLEYGAVEHFLALFGRQGMTLCLEMMFCLHKD